MTDLIERLLAHAEVHASVSPYDDEQAQWTHDLREAAAELTRLRAAQAEGEEVVAYDRELIARMLADYMWPDKIAGRAYRVEAIQKQIDALNAADNVDAAGVRTVNTTGPVRARVTDDMVAAGLAAAEQASVQAKVPEWQPIESAPKDGTHVIAMRPSKTEPLVEAMYFCGGVWVWSQDGDTPTTNSPTHWMPLPAAPKPSQEDA